MAEDFFSEYKDFVVRPIEPATKDPAQFYPLTYTSHYIITLSLYDSLISNWKDALRFDIDAKNSLERVLEIYNRKYMDRTHLCLLEIEADRTFLVLALSCKTKLEDAGDFISTLLDTILLTPLYISQNWYRMVGIKARIQRKLFSYSFREYSPTSKHGSNLIPYPTPHIR